MAFLCPSRRGRQKKKPKESKAPFLGRITGSSSVDTLVRVGLEKQHGLGPEARLRVTQDFLATRKDELGAQQGDTIYKLYEDGDWVYVITELGQEGFIPTICVTPAFQKAHNDNRHKRNSFSSASKNQTESNSDVVFLPSQNGHSDRTKLKPPNQLSRRRGSSESHDVSTHAETGSDVSSSSLTQGVVSPNTINPLPKPHRTHHHHHHHHSPSVPDVVSTTGSNPLRTTTDLDEINNTASKTSPRLKENPGELVNGIGTHGNRHSNYYRKDKTDSTGVGDAKNKSNKNSLSPDMAKTGLRSSQTSAGDSITEVKTFVKKMGKKCVVVFSFEAMDENDITVVRGEVVTVLNETDSHWTWIKKRNGLEGFVPRAFMCSIPENLLPNASPSGKPEARPKEELQKPVQYHDVRELYTLSDFTAQSADDISVKAGEQVFADLANQIERDWVWVYAPANQCYGYIPKDNISLPVDSLVSPKRF